MFSERSFDKNQSFKINTKLLNRGMTRNKYVCCEEEKELLLTFESVLLQKTVDDERKEKKKG